MSKKELNLETSKIAWDELQRFFASGLAISVALELDLIDVAYHFSEDNKIQVENWINSQQVHPVSDQQALKWYEANESVWAVVVKPWILVQENRDE